MADPAEFEDQFQKYLLKNYEPIENKWCSHCEEIKPICYRHILNFWYYSCEDCLRNPFFENQQKYKNFLDFK